MVKLGFEAPTANEIVDQMYSFLNLIGRLQSPQGLTAETVSKNKPEMVRESIQEVEAQPEVEASPVVSEPPSEASAENSLVTLENLTEVDIEELIKFCEDHKIVIDPEQARISFFRRTVEHKVRTYLTNQ